MYEKYPIHISQLKVIFDTLKLIITKRKINPTETHNSLPMSILRGIDIGKLLCVSVGRTFRRRPGRLLNVLCTFNLRPVSTGYSIHVKDCVGKVFDKEGRIK